VCVVQVFCDNTSCSEFEDASLVVARGLLFLLVFGILFTSGMLLNQIYGIVLGLGTIDRYDFVFSFVVFFPLVIALVTDD
jgi:hypothetical protein